ncbi:MAG: hypothetical protein M3Z66_16335, partial [Chloroflexota bacterium]|nr:hypothetical protein [Chloroflexota bacterium]
TDRHRPNSTDAGGAAWLAVPCLLGRPVGLPISFGGAPPLQSLSCNENSRGAGEVDDGAWYRDHVAPAVPWHTFERPPHLARASLALSMVALAASIALALSTVALVPLPVIGLVLTILILIDTAILASSYFRDPAVLRKRLLSRQRRLQLRRTRESQWRIRQLDGSMESLRRKDERRRQKLVNRRAAILTRERAERQAVEADLHTNLDLLDATLRDLDATLRDELAVAVGAAPMVDTLREAIVTKHVAQRKRLAERRTRHEGKAEARRQAIDNRYATRYSGLDTRLAEEDRRLKEHLTALETPLAEARHELREARETIDLTTRQLHAYQTITPRGYARFIVWQQP